MATRFRSNPRFKEGLRKPHRGSSVHQLGDALRRVSDGIRDLAKASIQAEHARAEATVQAIKHGSLDNNAGKPGQGYTRAKATANALKTAAGSTVAVMENDGFEIYGRVAINRRGSVSLEYGGTDEAAQIGNTGEHVSHPAYAFLRRAAITAKIL